MKHFSAITTAGLLTFGCSLSSGAGQQPQTNAMAVRNDANGGQGSGAFATGRYRNLFVEAGHSRAETERKIAAAFRQLFHGDPGTEAVYFPAGANSNGPLAYICDVGHGDVRSEGMSYGMMIAVQLDKRAEFDALWNWARTWMYHGSPNHPSCGFFFLVHADERNAD